MMEATLDDNSKHYALGGLAYGHTENSVQEHGRDSFGRNRYFITALKDFLLSADAPKFPVKLSYRLSKKPEDWVEYKHENVFSLVSVTHEVKSTITSSKVFPVLRIDEEKLLLFIFGP